MQTTSNMLGNNVLRQKLIYPTTSGVFSAQTSCKTHPAIQVIPRSRTGLVHFSLHLHAIVELVMLTPISLGWANRGVHANARPPRGKN